MVQPLPPLKKPATPSLDTDTLPHTTAASTASLMPIMAPDHTTRTSGDMIRTTTSMPPLTMLLLITSSAMQMLTTLLTHPTTSTPLPTTLSPLTRDITLAETTTTMATHTRVFSQKDTPQ